MGAAAFRIMRERMANKATTPREELDEAVELYISNIEDEDLAKAVRDAVVDGDYDFTKKTDGTLYAKSIKILDDILEAEGAK